MARLAQYKTPLLLLCLAAAIAFPLLFSNPSTTSIAFFTLTFAAAGTAWNIFSGYSGYIALGHAAYFGTGAYTLAILCAWWHVPAGWSPFLFVPLVGLVAAALAVPLGALALRTRKHTFIVITIAFFFIFQLLAENNLFGLTGGEGGLTFPIPTWSGDVFNLPFYYVLLVILLVALGVSWWVRHSNYGLELLAIRDDEDRARGLGVHTMAIKLSAFVLSAFFVGMVGAVWAYFLLSVYPAAGFDAEFDVVIALMAFMGGLGTLSGPIVGALILIPANQLLTMNFTTAGTGTSLILYGVVFLAVILLLPEGIVPTAAKYLRRTRANEDTPVAPSPVGASATSFAPMTPATPAVNTPGVPVENG